MVREDAKDKSELISLTPNNHIEGNEKYQLYFDKALKNDQIKNIAITGNYGSGKSSIILTYFEQSEYKDKILQISLANFKNGSEKDSNGDNSCDHIKNIEKNIINQILYQIPTNKIPLTSFRIKREITFWTKVFLSVEVLVILSLFLPINIFEDFDFTPFKYFFLSIFLVWNFYTFLNYMSLKKINLRFQNVEAEINNQNDELFEKYADEIVYLLEKSERKILIIEDLDRFEQLNIFEKLRELNIKVNNKLKNSTGEKFVFIYAIKDDLFIEPKDRIKFFDLIIPVIPYINFTNSYEKMKNELFKYDEIDDDLLYLLSNFVDDMRLLYNIHNEFIVYKSKIETSLKDRGKLLSLIVYKNLFNKDFEESKLRKGVLYRIVNSMEDYRDVINVNLKVLNFVHIRVLNYHSRFLHVF